MEGAGEKLHTMREACSILGIHPNTLRRWDKEGKIRTVRPQGGQRRIPESEIARLLLKPQISQAPEQVSSTPQQTLSKEEQFSLFLNYVFSYHKDDWELVKRAILIRDNYTCSKCGGKELLDVHHRDGTSRNDSDNLTTLCKKCHQEIHKVISEQKAQKIPPKEKIQPQEKPKTEIKPAPALEKEIPRHKILGELGPSGLAQRTAFGDLISAATVLKNFSIDELAVRARCPASITQIFCERMTARGYLLKKDGKYEMRATVVR